MLEKIDLNSLDKSNWETFRFEEIAAKISETVLPEAAEVDIYIGLEHIDREDIHIRRQGAPADVKGGKLRCYPGDVIFGKRRAYQRKAAIVDFDGICSAHAFVFRANKDVVDPELLPFFLHSDQFMHRMVDISVGGLSPTINWGDLKHEEFLLPPKEEQAKLAKLLWAMDEVIEKDKKILKNLQTLESSVRKIEISVLKGDRMVLDEIILPMSKIEVGKIEKSKYNEIGKYPIIDQSLNFVSGYSDDQSLVYKGDLPVIVFGDHTTILKFINFPFVMGADGTKVIKPNNNNINVYYLYQLLLDLSIKPEGYKRHFSILKSKTVNIINDDKLIERFNNRMLNIDKSIRNCESKISSAKSLKKNLINQIF